MVWRATESAERILKKRNCSPCRRSHAVGFSNASRDSSLKRLFISIYFMPRNHLFSEYSANYKTRRRIERTEAERCNFLFLFALRERSLDPDSSFYYEGPINFQWTLRTAAAYEEKLFIPVLHLPPSRPLFPSFSSPEDPSLFKEKKQQASRSSCFLHRRSSLSSFPVVPLPRSLLAKEKPKNRCFFLAETRSFSLSFQQQQQAGKREGCSQMQIASFSTPIRSARVPIEGILIPSLNGIRLRQSWRELAST